jgi:hypothetical protein
MPSDLCHCLVSTEVELDRAARSLEMKAAVAVFREAIQLEVVRSADQRLHDGPAAA